MNLLHTHNRRRLQPGDVEFILQALAGTAEERLALLRLLADPSEADAILDHPRLCEAVFSCSNVVALSPEFFFYVVVRHLTREAGINDIGLADYLAGLLATYARAHNTRRSVLPDSPDPVLHATDLIEAAERASPYERFFVFVDGGNRLLLLTGIFPGRVRRREARSGAPGLAFYEQMAMSAFQSAYDHPLCAEFSLRDVYRTLLESFAPTRRVLNRLGEEFLVLGS